MITENTYLIQPPESAHHDIDETLTRCRRCGQVFFEAKEWVTSPCNPMGR